MGEKYQSITGTYDNLLSILGFHGLDPEDPEHGVMIGNIASFGMVLAFAQKRERDLRRVRFSEYRI